MKVMTLWGEEEVRSQECIKCGKTKSIDQFNSRSNTKNDIRNDCKQCQKESAKVVKKLKEQYPQPNIETYRCAICDKSKDEMQGYKQNNLNNNPFVLDHDHESGEFRGWICNYCNVGLSRFFDDVKILKNAIRYLERQ